MIDKFFEHGDVVSFYHEESNMTVAGTIKALSGDRACVEVVGTDKVGPRFCSVLISSLRFSESHLPYQPSSVDHPPHYNSGKIEVIDAIEDWKLGFSLGNAVKYIARAEHKGKHLEDLKKAAWYLAREIKRLEGK